MVRVLVASFLLMAILGGCAGKGPAAAPTETLGQDVAIEVTDTTGAIRGVVVDNAIRPIANVTISLSGSNATQDVKTGATGSFGFSKLPAGTYFLHATRFGFFPIQQSAEVVPGVKDPPVVKILMQRDNRQVAYLQVQKQEGYIVCTTSVVAVCGAPNVVSTVLLCPAFNVCLGNLTDDRFGLNFFYDPNATMIQSEMFWDSTQSLSTQLSLEMENLGNCTAAGDSYIKDTAGDSPIFNKMNAQDIQNGTIGGNCPVFHSVFSGGVASTPPTPATGPIGIGGTIQQRFTIISHAFYGYEAPEGWRFSVDGDPPAPPT
jgi:hypothetical protein